MNKQKSVIFVHQKHHIGGGQTYVNQLLWGFEKEGYSAELIEGEEPVSVIIRLAKSKTKIVVWSVYESATTLPYIASFLLGKKNLLNIYGIWKLESRSHFVNENWE